MYRILICDDEEKILQQLKKKISDALGMLSMEAHYTLYSDPEKLLNDPDLRKADLLFLDIDMPHYSGMDIAKYIRDEKMDVILVFVTSHDAMVYQTFAYKPFAFLRKDHLKEDLPDFLSRIQKELEQNRQEIFITRGTETCRIRINDIVYLESEGNYVNLFMRERSFRFRGTLSDMEEKLDERGFIRCHRGYLVNYAYVIKYRPDAFVISYGTDREQVIPIGRSYEKSVKKTMIKFMR